MVGTRLGRALRRPTVGCGGAQKASWLVAAASAVSLTLSILGPAAAQSRSEPETEYGEGLEPFEADGPLIAVVSLGSQQIRVLDRNGIVATSRVSTGRKGYETPEGIFSIIERKVEHTSNLYDDASMPFMQRITWSGVALHEGVVPNYRASHGCIRLPGGFAERLFRTTKTATRVLIVPHDGLPEPLSHPALFQPGFPRPSAVAEADPGQSQSRPPLGTAFEEAPMMLGARRLPRPDASAAAATGRSESVPESKASRASGLAELAAKRKAAEAKLAAATKAVNDAKVNVRPRLIAQGKSEKALRQAIALARRAEGRAEAVGRAATAARGAGAQAVAEAAHVEALIELAQARGRQGEAELAVAEATAAALSIQDHVARLEAERQSAHNEVRAIVRKLSPFSVLVSRQTGKIYVRQAFHPVMELAITIKDPERPIGTHVFTALADRADGEAVTWMALTVEMPGGGSPLALPGPQTRPRKGQAPQSMMPARPDPLASAKAALARIEMPEAVLARIAPTLQPGSTIILSDHGPSIETGPGTDIVVQTRGEEQAAANIAKFVAKKKAEALAESKLPAVEPAQRSRSSGGFSRTGAKRELEPLVMACRAVGPTCLPEPWRRCDEGPPPPSCRLDRQEPPSPLLAVNLIRVTYRSATNGLDATRIPWRPSAPPHRRRAQSPD